MKYSARNKTWTDVKRIERLSIKLDPAPGLLSCANCREIDGVDALYSACHGNWQIVCDCGEETKPYRSLNLAVAVWNKSFAEALTA